MIVAMAGLPASGKSAVARLLATRLPAVLLDKDAVRGALFPSAEIDYSTAQDDLCVDVMLQVAGHLLHKDAGRVVILDGRPFVRRYQIEAVRRAAAEIGTPLCIIECICSDEVACARLSADVASGAHPAANRDLALHLRMKAQAESIHGPKLVIDTGTMTLGACVDVCLEYLAAWV